MIRKLISTLTAGVALLAAGHASAGSMVFDGTAGQSFTSVYNAAYYISPTETINLSAEVKYTLFSINAATGVAVFNVDVKNTTLDQTNTNRLTGFAIDVISPPLTGASSNSLIFNDVALNSQLNNGGGKVDFCAASQNACNGGGGGGLADTGNTALSPKVAPTFQLTMSFAANSIPPITFTNFAVRFQSIGSTGASTSYFGCVKGVDTGCGTTIIRIPEPTSLALAGLALIGLGAARRRKLA